MMEVREMRNEGGIKDRAEERTDMQEKTQEEGYGLLKIKKEKKKIRKGKKERD